jgi:hypothetical protein
MATQDGAALQDAWPSLERALLWLRYQDSNECGLIEVHEAMDWADLFANRYNVLYDNALYYAAWKCMGQLAAALDIDPHYYFRNARDVHKKINVLLWVGPEEPKDWDWVGRERKEWRYPLRRVETELVERWFHGQSGRPMGYGGQSWSAAMYLVAADCVERGQVTIFNGENGWKISETV